MKKIFQFIALLFVIQIQFDSRAQIHPQFLGCKSSLYLSNNKSYPAWQFTFSWEKDSIHKYGGITGHLDIEYAQAKKLNEVGIINWLFFDSLITDTMKIFVLKSTLPSDFSVDQIQRIQFKIGEPACGVLWNYTYWFNLYSACLTSKKTGTNYIGMINGIAGDLQKLMLHSVVFGSGKLFSTAGIRFKNTDSSSILPYLDRSYEMSRSNHLPVLIPSKYDSDDIEGIYFRIGTLGTLDCDFVPPIQFDSTLDAVACGGATCIMWQNTIYVDLSCRNISATLLKKFERPEIKLYPNPGHDFLVIEGAKTETVLTIYDAVGKSIFQKSVNLPIEIIDAQHFATGTYLVRIESRTFKWIKSK